jgi:GNAT superfamily N-acetyltransferase
MNTQLASISIDPIETQIQMVNNMSLSLLVNEMPVQKYSLAKGLTDNEAATLALDYQLFIKDRLLHRALLTCKLKASTRVYLAVDRDGRPVGVGMVVKSLVHVYVQRELRRQGIGTMIIEGIRKRVQQKIIGAPGIPGWDAFYKKNGVTCFKVV